MTSPSHRFVYDRRHESHHSLQLMTTVDYSLRLGVVMIPLDPARRLDLRSWINSSIGLNGNNRTWRIN